MENAGTHNRYRNLLKNISYKVETKRGVRLTVIINGFTSTVDIFAYVVFLISSDSNKLIELISHWKLTSRKAKTDQYKD